LARKSAFIKAKKSKIFVLEDFNFETPNTKNFINVLKALELENKKSLFVLGDSNVFVVTQFKGIQRSK
jgi:large subunit ribosomal protein L4